MLMTLSYCGRTPGLELSQRNWFAQLGWDLVRELLMVNPSWKRSSQRESGVPNSVLKHTVHARRAGTGTAPWDTAFPEGLWDEGQKHGHRTSMDEECGWGVSVGHRAGGAVGPKGLNFENLPNIAVKNWSKRHVTFLCIIRAAAALKLGLGSLLPRAEIQSRRSTRAFCSISQICQCFCAVLWGKSTPWTLRPKKN